MNAPYRNQSLGHWVAAVMLLLCVPAGLAFSEEAEEQEKGWRDTAEFSLVTTTGNSEVQTLGLKNKLWREWGKSLLELNGGAVRSESTQIERTAVGTPDDFDVDEDSDTELTAEHYYFNGRYSREITDRLLWFGSAGWERNRFAGIDDRYTAGGGIGNIWLDREDLKFRTDYALTFTKQEDVAANPDVDDTFLGLRFSWAYSNRFGENTVYTNDLILDENIDETDDFRANMTNSVAVAINERLALKVSHQVLYDNEPSLVEVDLFDSSGNDTGETVLIELDEIDTVFTASLVVNF